jgi:DNA modification methylase
MLWMHKANDVTNPWRGWMMNGEPILVSSVGKPEWGKTDAVQDCYTVTHDVKEKIAHKSVKPLPTAENLIKHTTGIVYEPFSGSGTTLIACERLGRKCRAVEISPAYVAVALQRWADMTGKTPELVTS